MNKKQKLILIIGIIIAVLLVAGGSYAFWMWTSDVNKNIAFNTANLEKYIVYDEGDAKFIGNFQPVSSFCESAYNTISFHKKNELQEANVVASINMRVNSIGENIASSSDVYWIVTSSNSDINCSDGLSSVFVLSFGSFNGITNGQELELYKDIKVTSTEQVYTVWIWIDSNGSNLLSLSGETVDTNIWTDFKIYDGYSITLDANSGHIDEINYTSPGEHIFNVSESSLYQLEVWGAQGGAGVVDGASKYIGGYGGYSSGTIKLNAGKNIYINVGGMGGGGQDVCTGGVGGYNGGGVGGDDNNCASSNNEPGAGGGGATHIATLKGELSSLSSYVKSILIVAGGGGGGAYDGVGGSGGGVNGVTGNYTSDIVGTQTGGYAFGLGGNGIAGTGGGGGGGGGYYGGFGGTASGGDSGSGGSGYIGNVLLSDKSMYCYNCTTSDDIDTLTYSTTNYSDIPTSNYTKSGDGAAKISKLITSKTVFYNTFYDDLPIPTRDKYTFLEWNTEEDGSGTTITRDTIVSNPNKHTLYAQWKSNYIFKSGEGFKNDVTSLSIMSSDLEHIYNEELCLTASSRYFVTDKTIDVSNYSKLRISGVYFHNSSVPSGNHRLYLGVYGSTNGDAKQEITAASTSSGDDSVTLLSKGDFTIDISDVTGNVYIGGRVFNGSEYSGCHRLRIYDIWLE